MECYITYSIKGFYGFNSENELIAKKLFPENEIISRLMEIENKKITKEEIEIIEELSKEFDVISIESNKRLSDYENNEKIKIEIPNQGGDYLRTNYEEFNLDEDEIVEIYEKLALYKMKKLSKSKDKHLIQAINSIDEIDEAISKLIERIREWYALYFPEMEVIKNNETYIKLISENKTKSKIIEAKSEAFLIDIDEVEEDIDEFDLDIMNNYANSIYTLQKTRKDIETYIDNKMEDIAPNLKLLVGSTLGAKLIAHAGGAKRLATYSASTIQIMGAEKALFRHLKTGDNPPKYGLIYQHPQVRGSKWWNRGKIARMLSSKITLAIRRDVFTKTYDPETFNKFIEKVEAIEKENPFPTRKPKKPTSKPSKPKKRKKKGKKHKKNKKRR